MVKMPNYVFHRGQSNKGTKPRTMFQIILSVVDKCIVSHEIKILDSELDENDCQLKKLLASRTLNTD